MIVFRAMQWLSPSLHMKLQGDQLSEGHAHAERKGIVADLNHTPEGSGRERHVHCVCPRELHYVCATVWPPKATFSLEWVIKLTRVITTAAIKLSHLLLLSINLALEYDTDNLCQRSRGLQWSSAKLRNSSCVFCQSL